ncbi:chemotaxis protein CheW [Paraglaciecola aestuariivivens]
MSQSPFANEDVMEDYMSALLTDEPIIEEAQRQSVEQLLNTAPSVRSEPFEPAPKKAIEVVKVLEPQVENNNKVKQKPKSIIKPVIPTEEFQVLLFEVAGMTLAVPLMELGGIHKLQNTSPIFGKPAWFKGVLLHRDEKFSVVDTAKWVMPKTSVDKLADSINYQYLVLLGESGWGLACESLVTTEVLLPEDVKWRNVESSRPWLSGMIKKKMCALVNVQQMISMLSQGLSSND